MSVERVNKKIEHIKCPACNMVGQKLVNVSGIRKCQTNKCSVDSYIEKGVEFEIEPEIVECPNCGYSNEVNSHDKPYCFNPNCRVKNLS